MAVAVYFLLIGLLSILPDGVGKLLPQMDFTLLLSIFGSAFAGILLEIHSVLIKPLATFIGLDILKGKVKGK